MLGGERLIDSKAASLSHLRVTIKQNAGGALASRNLSQESAQTDRFPEFRWCLHNIDASASIEWNSNGLCEKQVHSEKMAGLGVIR